MKWTRTPPLLRKSHSKIRRAYQDVLKFVACTHAWTIGDNAWSRVKSGTKRHCPKCGVTETMFWVDGKEKAT